MAKFDVLSLYGTNVDFAYFNVFDLMDVLGVKERILKSDRVVSLVKKHGRKHRIVSIAIRQVLLSELKPFLNSKFLSYDAACQDLNMGRSDYERRYEAEEKFILICFSLAMGKSIVSIKHLKSSEEIAKLPREFYAKGKSLYQYLRQTLNDNTRDYVLSYKEGKLDAEGELKAEPASAEATPVDVPVETSKASDIAKKIEPVAFTKEIETALSLMGQGVGLIVEEVNAVLTGKSLELPKFASFCQKLSDSYDRNPYALLVVRHIQDSDAYVAQHSVGCAILACHLTKALKLDARYVQVISMGALLFDLGRFKLPDAMTKKTGKLTDAEFQLTRKHLQFGEAILASSGKVPKVIYQMLWEHHERPDGAGYPQGKADREISVYGYIGAIVDAYDSLTSEQPHKPPLTPSNALQKMSKEAGLAFDSKLLAIFKQSLGMVPVGTCVELSNGRLGFVLTLNSQQQPALVRQVYSLSSKSFIAPIDLAIDRNSEIRIVNNVLPSDYGLTFGHHLNI
ncbi:Cyclic di-GMP phosphodiesterase response regulator RpfG [Marinomonas aquimarina]|uniref:Cyclic di-GMP phosphodiesterase response regulator RpfG n=1 Tax=Marinomonas aquimarina TaxID=295068 RepID=A0A1A8T2H0_9GAMM|nr:HD domain-containing phosphohydrolase [Marinomonas aquimarina]SBS25522.1 Cyclic di-GMP phosphodiesterase response regulator RpfG [Marinomonas aquimarina]